MIKGRKNYYSQQMSRDYDKLRKLLDDGYVVVCYVDYKYCTGERTITFRDIAKAKSNDANPNTENYGYSVSARGIVYIDWKRSTKALRHVSFEELCDELNLEFIDSAKYNESIT